MEIIYKNNTIRLDEKSGMWNVDSEDGTLTNANLNEVRKAIDGWKKEKEKFSPFEAWLVEKYEHGYSRVTITSIANDNSVWVKYTGGKREKISSYGATFVISNTGNDDLVMGANSLAIAWHNAGDKFKEATTKIQKVNVHQLKELAVS